MKAMVDPLNTGFESDTGNQLYIHLHVSTFCVTCSMTGKESWK